ncbi:MAG: threonylcarbamoyl-AMP synthase [Bacteroidales bacterium]|jgi:L-threonylcarbamoyladenylate synthase|nr:threonylcarbamoyl-AMP synthase [Bacteroidales bacterium]MCI2121566.1 threonylcarbamoyl-AMP synthase [Bacteroidales bacterium]MCI2145079.1 threonylcarbamoyl-AMP synthase [Bacteroidales bacterium]
MGKHNEIRISDRMRKDIAECIAVLENGGLILYPTDTVWGIGCDATSEEAVAKVFALKRRAESKSLVTLVADMDMLGRYVRVIPSMAIDLLEVNDAPMTIIYPGAMGLARNVVAEDGTIGIRVPDHEFCRRMIFKFNRAIVSTSANISGEPAPHNFKEISPEIMAGVDWVAPKYLEGTPAGKPSQIIKVGLDNEVTVIR